MSIPLATIFHGDVTLEQGSDVTQFGWGDLNINRFCNVKGTDDSINDTTASLVVAGGTSIKKTLNVYGNFNTLYGITNLTETHIDTTNGPFTVTGGNKCQIEVDDTVTITSLASDLNLNSTIGSININSGSNTSSAISIKNINTNGGIYMISGQAGSISVGSGSGGFSQMTSNGNFLITANNGYGSFLVNSQANNQNLSINLNGNTDSQLSITSSGTSTALVIKTTNTAGNMIFSNTDGLGEGFTQFLVGSGGFNLITNTGGSIQLTSKGAPSSLNVISNNNNQHLTLSLDGNTNSSLILKSDGFNEAIKIYTTCSTGDILITQPSYSYGMISLFSGMGGIKTETQDGGSTTIKTNGATSLFTNSTISDNQDLTISVTGNTNSKVNIASSGTSNQAININAQNGGVFVNANNKVQLESADMINGIQIATATPNVPVFIGTSDSTTTIYGNLDVKGVTSSIESTVVTISDNIIVVNNAPSSTADGGLAIKRYQSANNTGSGDVVNDLFENTGSIQNGSNTTTTIHFDLLASDVDNYYAGWWVKITGGTGQNQVRRIRSYVGATRVATIYSTDDQIGILNNPTPIEGMDFSTIPDSSSIYELYECHFVMMIWDESLNEFSFVCSNRNPSEHTSIAHYSDIHANNITGNALTINSINGGAADIITTVVLNNNSTVPITITDFTSTYGIYTVYVKPLNNSDSNRAHAIFTIGRVDAINLPGTVVRFISAKGVYNDQLDMQWPINEKPQLMYRPSPNGIGGSTTFKIKIVSL
jgi:hypothetical protein